MSNDDADGNVTVTQSNRVPGDIYVMVYHQTLNVAQAKALVRKLLIEISEAVRRRPCTHPPGMTSCSWCNEQGDGT